MNKKLVSYLLVVVPFPLFLLNVSCAGLSKASNENEDASLTDDNSVGSTDPVNDTDGGSVVDPDGGLDDGGFDTGADDDICDVPDNVEYELNELPEVFYFRDNIVSFNTKYYFVVRDGDLWVRNKDDITAQWKKLNLPAGLAGEVTAVSAEDLNVIALSSKRQVWTMVGALDAISGFSWKKSWGLPYWMGPGIRLLDDVMKWDFSLVSPRQDKHWTDPIGHKHAINSFKCSHIIMLRNDGQWITFNDPWLPTDFSYGIGMPKRCRFKAVNLSASGSTTFVINEYGDMYTRLFDFDLSGMDKEGVAYSYVDQTNAIFPKIQLPPEDWETQPKIAGQITDRISIHKEGKQQACADRILRIEGLDEDCHTGYFEKPITATNGDEWIFHRTDLPLMGTLIDNRPADMSDATLGPSEDLYYAINMENQSTLEPSRVTDWAGEILDFNCYCPPHTFRVHTSAENHFDLMVHTNETIRLTKRARGVDDVPRVFWGAIEVPDEIFDDLKSQPQQTRAFINKYLHGNKFTTIGGTVTSSGMTINLKRNLTNEYTFKFGS